MSSKGSRENVNNTSKYNYDRRGRHTDNEKLCTATKARPGAKHGHIRTPKTAVGTREAQERLGNTPSEAGRRRKHKANVVSTKITHERHIAV